MMTYFYQKEKASKYFSSDSSKPSGCKLFTKFIFQILVYLNSMNVIENVSNEFVIFVIFSSIIV